MAFAVAVVLFVLLFLLGLPIAFNMGISGAVALLMEGHPLSLVAMRLVSAAKPWVLLAVPTFIFAGLLMERCGISYRLVDLARATVGWIKGGLGMSVVGAELLFSGVSGSTIADVSAIGSIMTPPMLKAGYKPEHAVSLVASATALGILIPPAIYMIVVGTMTNTSVVGIFLGGVIPGIVLGLLMIAFIFFQAHRLGWPTDVHPSLSLFLQALRRAAIPLVIPAVIIGGFRFGLFTATEAGAITAGYALLVALVVYRNISLMNIARIALDSAVTTAVIVLLLGAASIFAFLLGVAQVPEAFKELMSPLEVAPWAYLLVISLLAVLFGLFMEGLPAAVLMLPVIFPTAQTIGIHPIHFLVVLTLATGIGLFLPPTGVGLLMALRFANLPMTQQFKAYVPYILVLILGLLITVFLPELSLWLPRGAGIE